MESAEIHREYVALMESLEIPARPLSRRSRRQALEQLNAKVMQQAAVIQTDRFVDFCLEEIYRTNRQ